MDRQQDTTVEALLEHLIEHGRVTLPRFSAGLETAVRKSAREAA